MPDISEKMLKDHDMFPSDEQIRTVAASLKLWSQIPGWNELALALGPEPCFADGEIDELLISRNGPSHIIVYIFSDMRNQPLKYFRVTLHFERVVDLQLEGLTPQNVIGHIILRQNHFRADRVGFAIGTASEDWDLEVDGCFGISGWLRVKGLTISFTPSAGMGH